MDGAVVEWACENHTDVSLSTAEVYSIAASQARRKLLEIKDIFDELDMIIVEQMPMWIDTQAAINQLERVKVY